MKLNGARLAGTFNVGDDEAFSGVVYVNKSNIPGGILSIIGGVTVPSDGEWHEVSSLGSCKLVARKRGAVQRYGIQHYGYYDCCKKVTVELAGHETYGISRRSMPNWAGLKLDEVVRFMYGEDCGKPVKVRSWTRTSVNTVRVVVVDSSDFEWELIIRRDESNLASVYWHLLNDPQEVDRLLAYINQGTGAFA